MIHNHWLSITGVLFWASGRESSCVILSQWLWIMVSYAEPVVLNHGVLFWASGCESWYVILSQWLWIMVCYAKPSGYESWCIMLSKVVVNHDMLCWAQCLWIMVYYAEPGVVNHGLSCWASGCESWWAMLSQWLWIMLWYAESVVVSHGATTGSALHTMIQNHWLSIAHNDSQPLTQHSTTWLATTGSA
jgi:hypothetical protein